MADWALLMPFCRRMSHSMMPYPGLRGFFLLIQSNLSHKTQSALTCHGRFFTLENLWDQGNEVLHTVYVSSTCRTCLVYSATECTTYFRSPGVGLAEECMTHPRLL